MFYPKSGHPERERQPQFHTADGWLTPYALACGYVESNIRAPLYVRLARIGGGYRVHIRDMAREEDIFDEVFTRLGDARRHFAHARALYVATREGN